jgi:uncharacterized protein YigA (DUF484 family)
MGLLPLEFTDCLQDSPYFRDSLHSHEKELERTSNNIKELVKEVKNLLQHAKSNLLQFSKFRQNVVKLLRVPFVPEDALHTFSRKKNKV